MSAEQCAVLDWRLVGERDGAAGRVKNANIYGRSCLDYGIRPDYSAYAEGYERGVTDYCTPGKGYTEGRAGHDYHHVCPALLEPAFLKEYQKGVEVYRQEQEALRIRRLEQERLDQEKARFEQERKREQDLQFEITQLKNDIFFKEMELDRKRWRLNDTKARLADAQAPAYFESSMNNDSEVKRLKQEIRQLNTDISHLDRNIEKAKDRLTILLTR